MKPGSPAAGAPDEDDRTSVDVGDEGAATPETEDPAPIKPGQQKSAAAGKMSCQSELEQNKISLPSKKIGNAWGVSNNHAETPPKGGQTVSNTKKRSTVDFLSDESDATTACGTEPIGKMTSKPKFADIMAEQESEKNAKSALLSQNKVRFCPEVESEEDRMMRLAIEASLHDQQGFQSHATKMPPPALKKGSDSGKYISAKIAEAPFPSSDSAYSQNDDLDDDMRMAIALSLKEAEGDKFDHTCAAGERCVQMESEDDRKPSALLGKDDGVQPSGDEFESSLVEVNKESEQQKCLKSPAFHSPAASAAGAYTESAAATATAAAAKSSLPVDESEKLAQALHQAELASQTASAASEAASLQLAMQLQQEEDAGHNLNRGAEAARLKREEMCQGRHCASVGVRTVSREEFNSLNNSKEYGCGKIEDRRKQEERGMGNLLSRSSEWSKKSDDDYGEAHSANGFEEENVEEGENNNVIRMNSHSSSKWKRLDKHMFIGPNNEIRTKHDPELNNRSNAVKLLDSHGARLKDAHGHDGGMSDRAYNAFRRAESRQGGSKKGVAKQGHGRAENMDAGKTRGGAMDGDVRLQISAAINSGLIENCHGVVKEGKEAMVYHADCGRKGRISDAEEALAGISPAEVSNDMDCDGYDVAVKVFKRIFEFKGRGSYVDGDARYRKHKFGTHDQREQVVLWAHKEYRNLIRAHRAGVTVPKPIYHKDNILYMRFLGENGWPSPQLKEIDVRKGSEKWTTFYCQTLVAIRRLYNCARLVHADLSEYNILICPFWQASHGRLVTHGKRTADDETLQVVLIDFGQAVEIEHPSAAAWLRRDLSTVRDFFVRQGIRTLAIEDAVDFVTDSCKELNCMGANKDEENKEEEKSSHVEEEDIDSSKLTTKSGDEGESWTHIKHGWDDAKDMDTLLHKLKFDC